MSVSDLTNCFFCGLTYQEHIGLDTMCQKDPYVLELRISLAEAQAKLDAIFALVETHQDEAYYRRTTADKKLWQAVLGLKNSTGI